MREIHAGDQCEHLDLIGSLGAYKKIRCTTTHLSRIDGKPQQLVIVREGRAHRKVCTKHAPQVQISNTRAKQKPKSDFQAEQVELL